MGFVLGEEGVSAVWPCVLGCSSMDVIRRVCGGWVGHDDVIIVVVVGGGVIFISFQSFEASDGIHAHVFWDFRVFGEFVCVCGTGESNVFGIRHEKAKVTMVASSKWTLNDSNIVNLELADCNGRGANVWVQWCEWVMR